MQYYHPLLHWIKHIFKTNKTIEYYAGVGSRNTPKNITYNMKDLASTLEDNGYVLRSGGAFGADRAFASGCNNAEIYIPWEGFVDSNNVNSKHTYHVLNSDDVFANLMVDKFHPIGKDLRGRTRLLMMRNTYQITGIHQHFSKFVVCWTPNGEEVGGTSQVIRIANHFQIPVYNMFHLTVDEILNEIKKLNALV